MIENIKAPPKRIGVFDSGIGGVTVYNEIRRLLGDADFFYCSDSLNFPYGTKEKSEVIDCALNSATQFYQKFNLDILVVACNTASTVALQALRDSFEIPVVGVVPAIKPAAEKSLSGVIALLATPGTVASSYTKDLISQFAQGFEVINVGSSELVLMAENYIAGQEVDILKLELILNPILKHPQYEKLDQLILGCTHFPFLKQHMQKILHSNVNIVDSGAAIAKRVHSLLVSENPAVAISDTPCKLFFTKTSQKELAQVTYLKTFNMVLGT